MAQQLSNEILNAALESLTSKRQQIEDQIAEVRRMLGESTETSPSPSAEGTRKRTISASGRQAIAEAQRRRWAAKKAAAQPAAAPKAGRPKRRLSAEGRRNIVAALKKRWAAKHAQTGTENNTATKRSPRKSAAKSGKSGSPTAGE